MPKSNPKNVKFFDTVLVKQVDGGEPERKPLGKRAWEQIFERVEKKDFSGRTWTVSNIKYVGNIARPTAPPLDHLALSRVRDRSEAIGQMNMDNGEKGPIALPDNYRVQETTYIVPIGQKGRVAVMSPGRSVRERAIGYWLTGVLGLAKRGESIELVPIINYDVYEHLQNAHGVTSLDVQVQASQDVDASADSGINAAVHEVQHLSPSSGNIRFAWTLPRDAADSDRQDLQSLATNWLLSGIAKTARATLREEVDGKIRTVAHDLVNDVIVASVQWDVKPDESLDESKVLTAISDAIQKFVKMYPVGGSK